MLLGLARDPQPAVDWSLAHQQLPLLASIGERRAGTVSLRRDSLLAEAERSLAAAQDRSYWLDRWGIDLNELMRKPAGASR